MSYPLHFADEFFTGHGDPLHLRPSDRPESVLQALVSLDMEERLAIARLLGHPDRTASLYVQTIEFLMDALAHVREVDTATSLSSPVEVWVDAEGMITLDIY